MDPRGRKHHPRERASVGCEINHCDRTLLSLSTSDADNAMQPSWPHTYASLPEDMEAEQLAVSIIGTGPFGRGLAERLAEGGAKVWLGTREPASLRCEVPGAITVVRSD